MRLAIISSLVLFPVLAHGQASTAAVVKPIPASAVVQAELVKPAVLKAAIKAAAAAEPANPISSMNALSDPAVREFVHTLVTEDFVHQALRQAGTLEYGFTGGEVIEESAPKMTRSVELQLSQQESGCGAGADPGWGKRNGGCVRLCTQSDGDPFGGSGDRQEGAGGGEHVSL